MWELIAALAAASFSIASGAAMSAAKRSGETREAVLMLQQQVHYLTERVDGGFVDTKASSDLLEQRFCHLCERMQKLENDFREHVATSHSLRQG